MTPFTRHVLQRAALELINVKLRCQAERQIVIDEINATLPGHPDMPTLMVNLRRLNQDVRIASADLKSFCATFDLRVPRAKP